MFRRPGEESAHMLKLSERGNLTLTPVRNSESATLQQPVRCPLSAFFGQMPTIRIRSEAVAVGALCVLGHTDAMTHSMQPFELRPLADLGASLAIRAFWAALVPNNFGDGKGKISLVALGTTRRKYLGRGREAHDEGRQVRAATPHGRVGDRACHSPRTRRAFLAGPRPRLARGYRRIDPGILFAAGGAGQR